MKTNKINKSLEILLITGILIVSLCSLVSAFGVSSSYNKDYPLEIYPGETTEVPFTLSTTDTEGNLVIRAAMTDGAGVASFVDSNLDYEVSVGERVIANVNVDIPENAPIGQEYIVQLSFTDITPNEGGMISLQGSSSVQFKVVVVEKPVEPEPTPTVTTEQPEESNMLLWIIIIVVVVVVAVVVILLIMKKKKASSVGNVPVAKTTPSV